MLQWIRSWPATIPPDRAYVVDGLPRLVIDNFDYSPLAGVDADLCLIEWDMAVSREDAERFELRARANPHGVFVAPYLLYHVAPVPVIAHRRIDGHGRERWIEAGETEADYFSFGLIYLPRAIVREFLAAPAPERGRSPFLPADAPYTDGRMHDQTFSVWHRHRYSRAASVPNATDVRPIHLHY